MKTVFLTILFLFATHSAYANNDYMLLNLPTQGLEIYVDGAKNSNPRFWCKHSVPLKIVTTQRHTAAPVINNNIVTAGIIAKQRCPALEKVSILLVSNDGTFIANGEALLARNWEPYWFSIPDPKTSTYDYPNKAPATVERFQTIKACNIRTLWPDTNDENKASATLINDSDKLTCNSNKLLTGPATISLVTNNYKNNHSVYFFNGYPLSNLPAEINPEYINKLSIAYADSNVILISVPSIADSTAATYYSIFRYNPKTRSWRFGEYMLVVINQNQLNAEMSAKILAQTSSIYETISNLQSPPVLLFTENVELWLNDQKSNTYLESATLGRIN